jgi:hypothetical protein
MLLPSGKHTKNDGKSPFLMGKYQRTKWPFSIALLNYQRVDKFLAQLAGWIV